MWSDTDPFARYETAEDPTDCDVEEGQYAALLNTRSGYIYIFIHT